MNENRSRVERVPVGSEGSNVLSSKGRGSVMNGGAGNDTIDGKSGKDILTGGTGKDWFVFDTTSSKTNTDTVKDFKPGQDKFALDNTLFKSGKSFYGAIKKGTPDRSLELAKAFLTIGSHCQGRERLSRLRQEDGCSLL
jgi:hypothetical protein